MEVVGDLRRGCDRDGQAEAGEIEISVDGDQMREKRSGNTIMQHAVAMLLTLASLD